MLWLVAGVGVVFLAHTAPFQFLLDLTDRTTWRMPRTTPPTIYLTFDDGPNPTTTPALLDVLSRRLQRGGLGVDDVGFQLVPAQDRRRARPSSDEPCFGWQHHRDPRWRPY